jgi:hypothetical protein
VADHGAITLFCTRKPNFLKIYAVITKSVAYKLQPAPANTPHLENSTPDVKISIKNKEYTAYYAAIGCL